MRPLALILGIFLTAGVTIAAIASMVVPRATRTGLAHLVTRSVLGVVHIPLRVLGGYRAQDRWLRLAAPISVLIQLAIFVMLVIVGIALVIYGQFDLTWKQAAWQSAATVTTLGTTEAVNWSSAMSSATGAFLGLVIIAVFMGYLVGLYSSYVARESLMAGFAQIAGEPAWGPMVLARSMVLAGDPGEELCCADWSSWMTDVRLGQQASPVLSHFRSPDPQRHWIVTMLSMLDATALALALGRASDRPAAVRCLAQGSITLGVLSRQGVGDEATNWSTETALLSILDGGSTAIDPSLGAIDDVEWAAAVDLLTVAGVGDRTTIDGLRNTVESMRAFYAADALALARELHAVRAPWSGARLIDTPVLWPCGPDGWTPPAVVTA